MSCCRLLPAFFAVMGIARPYHTHSHSYPFQNIHAYGTCIFILSALSAEYKDGWEHSYSLPPPHPTPPLLRTPPCLKDSDVRFESPNGWGERINDEKELHAAHCHAPPTTVATEHCILFRMRNAYDSVKTWASSYEWVIRFVIVVFG